MVLGLTTTAIAASKRPSPKVVINNEIIHGAVENGIEVFKGIPYAEPPVGSLRFKPPVSYQGSYDGLNASSFGPICINKASNSTEDLQILQSEFPPEILSLLVTSSLDQPKQSEDCLTINVFRSQSINYTAPLPVMVWIYGGSFQSGSGNMNATNMVSESVKMDQPVIYVSFNYRVGPWGFLGGKSVQAEGSTNNGLRDQRLALEWVQDNIGYFGGDKDRVTIFGESAGAMSVAHQMIAYNGNHNYKHGTLFSGAIMQSGGILSLLNASSLWPETLSTAFALQAGCKNQTEMLKCLRSKSTDELVAIQNGSGMDQFFGFVGQFLGWSPHSDGDIIPENPYKMVEAGNFTQVPYMTGTQEDEGTMFAIGLRNALNTEEQLATQLSTMFHYPLNGTEIQTFKELYPQNPNFGSPFRTDGKTALTPQYKRMAAFITDFLFQAPRRVLLMNTPCTVPRYNYFSQALHGMTKYLGTFHANDVYFQNTLNVGPYLAYRRYWISFANNYDPNVNTNLTQWDAYTDGKRQTLVIEWDSLKKGTDDFRMDQITYMIDHPEFISA